MEYHTFTIDLDMTNQAFGVGLLEVARVLGRVTAKLTENGFHEAVTKSPASRLSFEILDSNGVPCGKWSLVRDTLDDDA